MDSSTLSFDAGIRLHVALTLATIAIVAALVPITVRHYREGKSPGIRLRWLATTAAWVSFCLACGVILVLILMGEFRATLFAMQALGLLGAVTMVLGTRLGIQWQRRDGEARSKLLESRSQLEDYKSNLEALIERRTEALRKEIEERRSIQRSLTDLNHTLTEDLKLAGEMQQAMLSDLPTQGFCSVAVRYRPHSTVSGDTYVIDRDDNYYRVVLADAMGHGVAAALLTQVVQTGTRRFRVDHPGPKLLAGLNSLMASGDQMAYATAIHLLLSANGVLEITGAGNPAALIRRAADGSIETADGAGSPVGMFSELPLPYETSKLRLHPGDRVYLFTDGITEWRNPEGEMLGLERIRQSVEKQRIAGLEDALDGILQAGKFFAKGRECNDDICLLALEFNPRQRDRDSRTA